MAACITVGEWVMGFREKVWKEIDSLEGEMTAQRMECLPARMRRLERRNREWFDPPPGTFGHYVMAPVKEAVKEAVSLQGLAKRVYSLEMDRAKAALATVDKRNGTDAGEPRTETSTTPICDDIGQEKIVSADGCWEADAAAIMKGLPVCWWSREPEHSFPHAKDIEAAVLREHPNFDRYSRPQREICWNEQRDAMQADIDLGRRA